MSAEPIAILGAGLVTSVGCTAPASCSAFRAKIADPSETRFIDASGAWLMAHQVDLNPPCSGLTKLVRMAAWAVSLREILARSEGCWVSARFSAWASVMLSADKSSVALISNR